MSKNKTRGYDDLNVIMKERGDRILERFREVIASDISSPELLLILEEVKHYWRDFFRPALTLFSCEVVGGTTEIADLAGLMFTLAAAGIGIHDDVIDKSSTKHFKWTILGKRGRDKALLVGDLLLVKGWTMTHEMIRKSCRPVEIADVVKAYGKYSIEMCEAELMEISCRGKLDTDLKVYQQQVLWKLNADLEGCAKLGAILGGGSEKEAKALADFGRRLGYMFALIGDLKDCVDIEGNLISRLKYESIPLPILHSARSSKGNKIKIKSILEKSNISQTDLQKMFLICFESESFDYIQKIAKQNAEEASNSLRSLTPNKARNILQQMIENKIAQVSKLCAYAGELQAYFSSNLQKK